MEIREIEATVGRLYLTVVDLQKQIDDLKAQLAPKPASILAMADRRESEA